MSTPASAKVCKTVEPYSAAPVTPPNTPAPAVLATLGPALANN